MGLRGIIGRLVRNPQPAATPADLEALAGRLEAHTVNLAEHQALLRDEGLRRVLNEMRTNSAFLADSVVALDRVSGRAVADVHTALRPIVHRLGVQAGSAALLDMADRQLAEELATTGLRVTVVSARFEHSYVGSVRVADSLTESHELVVWVTDAAPTRRDLDEVERHVVPGGHLVLATTVPIDARDLGALDARYFVRRGGWVPAEQAAAALSVFVLRR